ncbi:unnamed protein product [Echinostoma caproni]|uniref:TPR_REGION domain-containing protein n=1 Tax=Echinostoma caproni TaxID=27848 RepID=A0A183AFF9_9TREM|nr:unnamed protein product [Echinostoma caproni]
MTTGSTLKAVDFFQQAYDYLPPQPSRFKAIILQNIGTAQAIMRRCDLANSALTEAIEMHRMTGNQRGIAETANNLGYVCAMRKKWYESRWNYVLSRQAALKVGLQHIVEQTNKAIQMIDRCQVTSSGYKGLKFRPATVSYYGDASNTPLKQCVAISSQRVVEGYAFELFSTPALKFV